LGHWPALRRRHGRVGVPYHLHSSRCIGTRFARHTQEGLQSMQWRTRNEDGSIDKIISFQKTAQRRLLCYTDTYANERTDGAMFMRSEAVLL